jgi:hypothetical protein
MCIVERERNQINWKFDKLINKLNTFS